MGLVHLVGVACFVPALAFAAGAEPSFQIVGGCREGAPNGAYELRSGDGQLRVAGAFHDGKRTGTFVFWNARGKRVAVIPYDEDVRTGTIGFWHAAVKGAADPLRRAEVRLVAGVLQGTRFSWHANGQRRSESEFDRGKLVTASAWDARGRALNAEAARHAVQQEVEELDGEVGRLEAMVADHQPQCDDSKERRASKKDPLATMEETT